MQELLKVMVQGLVKYPEEVRVTEETVDGTIMFHLYVAEGDMGRVIGKQGRIAKAIRTVMRAASARVDQKISIEIG